ncbi:MAG: glycosyltransferase family 2 protein [Pseudomonadota bacterium]
MGAADSDPKAGTDAARAAVVIPAWNASATIGRAVTSALAQSVPCDVIVVDDASPDDTVAAARAVDEGSGRLTVVSAPKNAGPAAARNLGVTLTEADWIVLLDADDFMDPGRVAGLIALAEPDGAPEWDLVADDLYRVVEGDVDGPRQRLISEADFTPYALDLENFVLGNLHGEHGSRGELGFLKPMMRRRFLIDHDIRYDEAVRLGEDYDIYARMLAAGGRMLVSNPLGYFAVARSDSISATHGTAEVGGLVAVDVALLKRPTLTAGERRAIKRHLGITRREWAWLRLIDAVKARAPAAALGCFAGPPDVALSLFARLGEQAALRARRRLGGAPKP